MHISSIENNIRMHKFSVNSHKYTYNSQTNCIFHSKQIFNRIPEWQEISNKFFTGYFKNTADSIRTFLNGNNKERLN